MSAEENKRILDIHSHILPGIDDGAANAAVSLEMIRQSAGQGITHMVATPHFYGWEHRIGDFLQDRRQAMEELQEAIAAADEPALHSVKILTGAEVAYFEGISRGTDLDKLTVDGTNVMLLEMPFRHWTEAMIKEGTEMNRSFHLILAHVERYRTIGGNEKWIRELADRSLDMQCNAEPLLHWKTRGAVLKLFQQGKAKYLGSDAHSLHRRPQNLAEGRAVLEKKLGNSMLQKLDAHVLQLFGLGL